MIKNIQELKFIKINEIIKSKCSYQEYTENIDLEEKVNKWFECKFEEMFADDLPENEFIKKILEKLEEFKEKDTENEKKEDRELKELQEEIAQNLKYHLKNYMYGEIVFNKYKEFMKNKSLKERFEVLLNTIGLSLEDNTTYAIIGELIKYVVCVQKNTNIICLGDKGTGKSFVYSQILNENFVEKRSDIPTVPELRGNKNTKNKLLKKCVFDNKVFVVDELSSNPPEGAIAELKKVLEDEKYMKADEKSIKTEVSIVLNGNKYNKLNKFSDLNKKYLRELYKPQLEDDALLDRFSGLILHLNSLMGEKILVDDNTKDGISIIQFQALIQYLRELEYKIDFSDKLEIARGSQSRKNKHVMKLVTGILKLLYPTQDEIPSYLKGSLIEFALHYISLTQKNENDMDIHNPFNENISKFLIELYKKPEEEIEYSIFLKNRFFMKIKGENYCRKIALTGFGIEDNKQEYNLIEKSMDGNSTLAKVLNKSRYYNIIEQENTLDIITNKNSKFSKDDLFPEHYNQLLLENIEYSALLGLGCPNKKFIGIPNILKPQLENLVRKELSEILKKELNENLDGIYGYNNQIELVNIIEAIN